MTGHSRLRSVVQWTEEPVWESIILVSAYTVEPVKQSPGRAEIGVTYQVKGKYSPSSMIFYTSRERIAFKLVETDCGWKIEAPLISPHARASAVIRSFRHRMKNTASNEERRRLEKDINLLKNMKRFSLGMTSNGVF